MRARSDAREQAASWEAQGRAGVSGREATGAGAGRLRGGVGAGNPPHRKDGAIAAEEGADRAAGLGDGDAEEVDARKRRDLRVPVRVVSSAEPLRLGHVKDLVLRCATECKKGSLVSPSGDRRGVHGRRRWPASLTMYGSLTRLFTKRATTARRTGKSIISALVEPRPAAESGVLPRQLLLLPMTTI